MSPDALAWISRFLTHLTVERRLSGHTHANYKLDLARFVSWCDQNALAEWRSLDSQHIRTFAGAEFRRGASPRTISRRLSALRSFFRFLIREGELHANPANEIQAPKPKKRLPATIDVDQMARLLSFRTDESLSVRDKAMMELFYSSGLRLSELVGLDMGDVDLADRTVRVLGKGAKTRIVPVGRYAAQALAVWLKERATLAVQEETALFVSRRGERLSRRMVQERIAGWAKRTGLGVHVHPHMFRHSFASHLLESSHDLRGVQELLGHANIATTQIYTHLDFQHLARIYDAAHPRAKRKP
ncbi:MAG TPA: tyrosine recombinase XerC [Steroidobacter sp.]|jgi:integrase/recombinase XerC|nr:tyrosine recombinase XerC [Steroidobacter sp.]